MGGGEEGTECDDGGVKQRLQRMGEADQGIARFENWVIHRQKYRVVKLWPQVGQGMDRNPRTTGRTDKLHTRKKQASLRFAFTLNQYRTSSVISHAWLG